MSPPVRDQLTNPEKVNPMSTKSDAKFDQAVERVLDDSRDEGDRALRIAVLTTALNVTPQGPDFLRTVLARAYAFHTFIVGPESAPTVH